MPELLFGIVPHFTPDNTFKSAPKTPSPLSDIHHQSREEQCPVYSSHQSHRLLHDSWGWWTRTCQSSLQTNSVTRESHKSEQLSRRQLKFEDGVSLQSIVNTSKENRTVEVLNVIRFARRKRTISFLWCPPRVAAVAAEAALMAGDDLRRRRSLMPRWYTCTCKKICFCLPL